MYSHQSLRGAGLSFLLFLLVGASTGCGGRSDEDDYKNPLVPHERLEETSRQFHERPCAERAVDGYVTQCGQVEVPVALGSSETTRVAVVRVFTNGARPEPDPVIYLDGGPGVATLENIPVMVEVFELLFPNRDLIFFDQRGVGRSGPELNCEGEGAISKVLGQCYDNWSKQVDLNSYRTKNSAHDVQAIADAFGYETLNIFGISYGTRLALTVMREHPDLARSVIIDSVVPLQVDLFAETGSNGYSALLALFEACENDASCKAKYNDPYSQLIDVVNKLNENPIVQGDISIDGFQFVSVIFQMMYSMQLVAFIPYLIDTVDQGDTELLSSMFDFASDEAGFSMGMHLSLQCAEEIAFSSQEAFEERDALVDPILRDALSGSIYLNYCDYWPVTKAPSVENEPVVSDIPTLVLAGKFDPITPPTFSKAAADYLSQSKYFLLESESHGASISACGANLVRSFTDNPRGNLNSSCVLDPPGLEFQQHSGQAARQTNDSRVNWQLEAPSSGEVERAVSEARKRRKVLHNDSVKTMP